MVKRVPTKGVKELKRIREAAQEAAPKLTDKNFSAGAHPKRGEIANAQFGVEQVEADDED